MDEELERALAFMNALDERCAERIVPFRFGTAFFHGRLDRVWDLNFLRVEIEATADELMEEADRLQGVAGLVHRKLDVNESDLGSRLEPAFRTLGWRVQRHIVMPHRRPTPERDLSLVQEVDEPTLRPVWGEGIRGAPFNPDEETIRQLLEHKRVIADASPTRYFAALVDGAPVSYCELYSDGATAQIEAVLTLEEYRSRGFASAVITKALTEARREGAEFVFLVADADDWPQRLYERLGFETVGLRYRFIREPAP